MSDNCVIYLRVSTDIQDVKRQQNDLNDFAKRSNLIVPKDGIFKDELSGFKDESERTGLQLMMNYCLKNNVKKVLIWELSRLARKQSTIHKLKEFFINHQINIYFFNQNKWLLNNENEITSDVSLMIAMMGWQAEYEVKVMKDRFRSRKKFNDEIGKYNGGGIPFGYKLDNNNNFIVNNDIIKGLNKSEADIVKESFEAYANGLVCSHICRINRSKNYPKIVSNTHTLARLLRNTSYIGYKKTKYNKRHTPAIISEELFFQVKKNIDENKTKADKGHKHVYLLRGILTCSYCNAYYVGKQTDDSYICPKNSASNKINKGTSCDGENISISNLDGVVWDRAKYWLTKWKVDGFDEENNGAKTDIKLYESQIDGFNKLIEKEENKRKKLNFIYMEGGYSPDEYKSKLLQIKKEKEKLIDEISFLQSRINLIEKQLKDFGSVKNRLANIDAISNREQKKIIINSLCRNITFIKHDKFKTVLFIKYYRANRTECIIYNPLAKKGNYYILLNTKFVSYDKSEGVFYFIKDPTKVTEHTSTEKLKELGVGEDLPDYISLNDFTQINKKHNLNLLIKDTVFYPFPNKQNSASLNFKEVMNMAPIEGIVSKHEYEKEEYFKNLNRERFRRKRNKK